jgi:thiol-disulfide isomerase/thioredoxin
MKAIAALLAFLAAGLILAQAGLPDRARYAGGIIDGGRTIAPELGALAPPFQADSLTGRLDLGSLRGAVVILNFWATWCEPCVQEMPYLQALYAANQERGLRLIAINLGEGRAAVEAWVQQHGLQFEIAFDPEGVIAAAYRLRGQPSTFVLAPTGEITAIYFGAVRPGQLEATIAPFLAG